MEDIFEQHAFVCKDVFELESGTTLPGFQLAYTTMGV